MRYDKLVRDGITDIIAAKGGRSTWHIADNREYWIKLKQKLEEEVKEFIRDENASELADLLEVVDAVIKYKDFDRQEIDNLRQAKNKERGGFEKRIILEESDDD